MSESRRKKPSKQRSVAASSNSATPDTNGALNRSSDAVNSNVQPLFLADAPRQPRTIDAWKHFAFELANALRDLEEDEWLVLSLKNRHRFVQVVNQGGAGYRAESISDFYVNGDDYLSESDRARLLELGWAAPTNLPDEFGFRPDGSPNYFLDLANPVPLDELAVLAVNTIVHIHGAQHPNNLQYSTGGPNKVSIRFPNLGIRLRRDAA